MAEEISTLLTTGLLALLGTVAGGVVKGYLDNRSADKDLHSKLLLRALEPNDADGRRKSLQFLIDTNLISDVKIKSGVRKVIRGPDAEIPQFIPVGSFGKGGALDDIINENSTLKGKELAFVALKVRHGNVIDAITPIYAEISPDLSLGETVVGKQYGGKGGGETVLERRGFIVTGINLYRGDYFEEEEVVQIELIWHRLTQRGIDPATEVISEKLGDGHFANLDKPAKQLRANPGHYISDFFASTSYHSSGETFLHDFDIKQRKLPLGNPNNLPPLSAH